MKVSELIDFYLSIRQPGQLIGFDSLFQEDLETLKLAIQDHYGDMESWLSLPEETELPAPIASKANDLLRKYED